MRSASKLAGADGAGRRQRFDRGSQDMNIVAVFRDRVAARPGDILKLAVPAERLYLFDATMGLMLD